MRRLSLTTLLSILAVLVLALPANAGWLWCKSDPVISLNGTVVDIVVAIPVDYVPAVNGPTQYEIATPRGVERQLILNDIGYNGHGSEVVFTDGPGIVRDNQIDTTVSVYVPIDESTLAEGETVPLEMTITPTNGEQVTVMGTTDGTTVELTIIGQ